MTTAEDLRNNPNPQEHIAEIVDTVDEAALEQQMNDAFEKQRQKLAGNQPEPQQVQPGLFTPATTPTEAPQQTQESTGDLTNQIEQAFAPTETPADEPAQNPEQPPEEASDRVKYLQQVFKDTLNIDIGEAVQTMNNFNETATGTMDRMKQMENNIALQQQRLDLMYTWGAEAQQFGVTPSQLVDQRLSEATKVFSTLNEELRTRIASQGSKGIIDLYNLIQKQRGGQQQPQQPQMTVPTQGRANIASTPQGNNSQQNLSDIVSMKSEDDFWRALQGGYNDNLGVIRR